MKAQSKMTKKYRVLHIAEAANPEWVSVPLVGWSCWESLSKVSHSHLVTQVRNQAAIERQGYTLDQDFSIINNERIIRPFYILGKLLRGGKGVGWTTAMALSYIPYVFFEIKVWRKFREKIINREFDIVHRITPVSPTLPSYLARKCAQYGVHFVIGPLNGGLPWPKEFDSARRKEKEWLTYIRDAYKLLPGYRSTRKNASSILIGSQATYNQLSDSYKDKAVYIPENGIDHSKFLKKRSKVTGKVIKAVFVGRLVPYKGVDMLIEALQELLREGKVQLNIIGDGPEKAYLTDMVQSLGVTDHVIFHGWISHNKLQKYLIQYDLLTFPSIREFGGGVVLESMALGLMPLIIDYGGPAELLTSKEGIKIPLSDRQGIIQGIRSAMEDLVANPHKVDVCGDEAYKRIQKFYYWPVKAEQIAEVYQSLMEKRAKPIFKMYSLK